MRTSPLSMRPRRRASAVLVALGLLVVAAACGDDGDYDDGSTPTTTAPVTTDGEDTQPDDGTDEDPTDTSADGADDATTDHGGPVAGDDVTTLTVEQAEAQLDARLAAYRAALLEAQRRGALDEVVVAGLQAAFTATGADAELRGLETLGAPESLNPDAPPLDSSGVTLLEAVDGCVSGSAEAISGYDEALVPGTAPASTPPFWFKLVPADSGDGWRIDFLFATGTPDPPTNVSCS